MFHDPLHQPEDQVLQMLLVLVHWLLQAATYSDLPFPVSSKTRPLLAVPEVFYQKNPERQTLFGHLLASHL